MSFTRLADIGYSGPVFNQYIQLKSLESLQLATGGLVYNDAELNNMASTPGFTTGEIKFVNDLTGEDSVVSDNPQELIQPDSISTLKDVCVMCRRAKSFASTELVRSVTLGAFDPMRVVMDRLADFWARRRLASLTSLLRGVVQSNVDNNSSSLVYDISKQTGGVPDSGTKLYHSYLFGLNSVGMAFGSPAVPLEDERMPDAGNGEGATAVYSRHHYMQHLFGFRWTGAVLSRNTPTNDDLANPLNWNMIYEPKRIRFVCIISNAKPDAGLGITADNCLSPETLIEAAQLLGDAKELLTILMVHSQVETYMRKLDIIDYMPSSEQGIVIPYYGGKRLLYNDSMYNWVAP
jgi:hypothetical protein